jgi:hypothetical protein
MLHYVKKKVKKLSKLSLNGKVIVFTVIFKSSSGNVARKKIKNVTNGQKCYLC